MRDEAKRRSAKILKSGHLLYQNNSFKHRVIKTGVISDRVIYVMLQLNARYTLQVIQVYAPTSTADNEQVELFYEDVSSARGSKRAHFAVIIGDFNAKLGQKTATDPANVGNFGLEVRNQRGQLLLDYFRNEDLFCMNTFFKKPPQRKWTWKSPNGLVKNRLHTNVEKRDVRRCLCSKPLRHRK